MRNLTNSTNHGSREITRLRWVDAIIGIRIHRAPSTDGLE